MNLSIAALLLIASASQVPARAVRCAGMQLNVVQVGRSQVPPKFVRVEIINAGAQPASISKARLAGTYRTEKQEGGRWRVIKSYGIGSGVASAGAQMPARKCDAACLATGVLLTAGETFSLKAEIDHNAFQGTDEEPLNPGRYRVVFEYSPDDGSCEVSSNAVVFVVPQVPPLRNR